jgi:D-alanine-D-alanine ligase
MARLRIGLLFERLEGRAPRPGEPPDALAEYEPESTVAALEAALRELGHEPVRIGAPHALLARAGRGEPLGIDAALDIAEGEGTRNREAWAPVLLEMLGIPALGSDALTLSLSLDKAWAKDVAAAGGVPTAPHASVESLAEAEAAAARLGFPLFAKPRWEGTAKGIRRSSRVESPAQLAAEVARLLRDYRQPALLEAFLPGAEYTVCVVGTPPRVLPVLQRALDPATGIGVHALAHEDAGRPGAAHTPGALTPVLERELAAHALAAFRALRCRDFARADFKLDAAGRPRFLEINPLPTFATDGSFAILAELAGTPYPAFLADVFAEGLRRLGL